MLSKEELEKEEKLPMYQLSAMTIKCLIASHLEALTLLAEKEKEIERLMVSIEKRDELLGKVVEVGMAWKALAELETSNGK